LSTNASACTSTFFSNAGVFEVQGTGAVTGSFSNSVGGIVIVDGSTLGDGVLTFTTGFLNAGSITLTNVDAVQARNATISVTSGVLTSLPQSVLQSLAGSVVGGTRTLAAMLDNQGLVAVQQTLTIDQASATHGNSGQIFLSGGDLDVVLSGTAPSFTNESGGVIDVGTNKLVITNQSNGTFTNQAGGTLRGSGTIDIGTSTFVQDGTVQVGVATPGILAFTGPYSQAPSTSALTLILSTPVTPGVTFSQFQVSQTVSLSGSLNAVFSGPYTAGSYPIITGTSITGDFQTKNLPLNPNTGGTCTGAVVGAQYIVTCPP